MDIYHRFISYPSTSIPATGVTFPPDMKALIITNTAGNTLINIVTYGATGTTMTHTISANSGTYVLPIKVWGLTTGSSSSLNYLIGF